MRCGRLWATKATDTGFGEHSIPKLSHVLDLYDELLYSPTKFLAVDEQANYNVILIQRLSKGNQRIWMLSFGKIRNLCMLRRLSNLIGCGNTVAGFSHRNCLGEL